MMTGIVLFALGWLGIAYTTSDGNIDSARSMLCMGSSLVIIWVEFFWFRREKLCRVEGS